jgi:hypothetical protein
VLSTPLTADSEAVGAKLLLDDEEEVFCIVNPEIRLGRLWNACLEGIMEEIAKAQAGEDK